MNLHHQQAEFFQPATVLTARRARRQPAASRASRHIRLRLILHEARRGEQWRRSVVKGHGAVGGQNPQGIAVATILLQPMNDEKIRQRVPHLRPRLGVFVSSRLTAPRCMANIAPFCTRSLASIVSGLIQSLGSSSTTPVEKGSFAPS